MAVVALFGCLCKGCFETKYMSTRGYSGHGPTWINAATAVQEGARRFFTIDTAAAFDLKIKSSQELEQVDREKVMHAHWKPT